MINNYQDFNEFIKSNNNINLYQNNIINIKNCIYVKQEKKIYFKNDIKYYYYTLNRNNIDIKDSSIEEYINLEKNINYKIENVCLYKAIDNFLHFLYDTIQTDIHLRLLFTNTLDIDIIPDNKDIIEKHKNIFLFFHNFEFNENLYKNFFVNNNIIHINSFFYCIKRIQYDNYNNFVTLKKNQMSLINVIDNNNIYISRRKRTDKKTNANLNRSLINEDKLVELLEKYSYKEIFLEDYEKIEDKIKILSEAKNIICLASATCVIFPYLQNHHNILIIKGPYKLNIFPYTPNNLKSYYYDNPITENDRLCIGFPNINWNLDIEKFTLFLMKTPLIEK